VDCRLCRNEWQLVFGPSSPMDAERLEDEMDALDLEEAIAKDDGSRKN
jgi:hypothetical protein